MTINNQPSTKKERVVVAMSGGVDSSVAAALLVEQGYDVVGIMMRLWSEPGDGANAPANRCCTPEQMADARFIADHLGIPFYVIDVQTVFRQTIVQFFIDEHENGRTPNPCIECNRQIRFTYLLNQALALNADYLATGHYARVRQTKDGYQLLKGLDEAKDQSYVLHMLTQEHLAQVKFPVGEYTKSEVRELARKFDLPVASKQDSQDLCFLGDGDYRRFLRDHSVKISQAGPIEDADGNVLGEHRGLAFYTIGQRKGLNLNSNVPLFVLRKEAQRNALIVGRREELGQQTMLVRDVSWVSGQPPAADEPLAVKIRYKARPVLGCVVEENVGGENGRYLIRFSDPVTGITPGQGAIFYDGARCLGGGLIADETNTSILLNDIPVAVVHR